MIIGWINKDSSSIHGEALLSLPKNYGSTWWKDKAYQIPIKNMANLSRK